MIRREDHGGRHARAARAARAGTRAHVHTGVVCVEAPAGILLAVRVEKAKCRECWKKQRLEGVVILVKLVDDPWSVPTLLLLFLIPVETLPLANQGGYV